MSLAERAILVRVKECMNGVFKYDAKAKVDFAQQSNADVSAYSITKRMWPKPVIDELRGYISSARHIHRTMTLPWNDVGYRLLPNEKFFDFVNEINEVKNGFIAARNRFKANFDLYKLEGLMKMGKYADSSIYPKDKDDIDELFQLEVMVRPCPNTNDIRVDLPEEVLKEMREQAEADIMRDTKDAVKEVWLRFHKACSHMHKQLDAGDPKYFRSSLLENVEELLKIIPSYNLTDDPELEAKRQEAEAIISNIKDIGDVKTNEQLRKDTVDKLSDMLDKFPAL
jgi:hypothetical protein